MDEAHGSVVFPPSAGPDFIPDRGEDVLHFGQQALVHRPVDALGAVPDLLCTGSADERGGDVTVRGGELERKLRERGLPLRTMLDRLGAGFTNLRRSRMPLRLQRRDGAPARGADAE